MHRSTEEVLGLVRLGKLSLGGCGAHRRGWNHELILLLLFRLLVQESVVGWIRFVEDELEVTELQGLHRLAFAQLLALMEHFLNIGELSIQAFLILRQ